MPYLIFVVVMGLGIQWSGIYQENLFLTVIGSLILIPVVALWIIDLSRQSKQGNIDD